MLLVATVFDGFGYPEEHIDYAISNGMDALALTDHGNMNGLSYAFLHAKKLNSQGKKFKPIFGVEAYFVPSIAEWKEAYLKGKEDKKAAKDDSSEDKMSVEDEEETKSAEKSFLKKRHHLVLLAMNQTGLNNIFKMVSLSHEEGNFYSYPRIDFEMLKQYNEGVIALQACLGGYLAKAMWENKDKDREVIKQEMTRRAKEFVDIFGDRYYLEMQWNAIPEQHFMNKIFLEIGKELGIKIVSTADSHYPNPDAWRQREIYKRLGWLGNKPDYSVDDLPKSRDELKYEIYPKNYDQMFEAYKKYSKLLNEEYDDEDIIASLEETAEIAYNRIEDFQPDSNLKLPQFLVQEGKAPISQLTEICIAEMKRLGLDKDSKYIERIYKELDVINKRDFAAYFITMKSISDEAKKVQLCSPGRGSAAGSLISFLCGITTIDPIKYELQFERFLLEGSDDFPDIDFDCSEPMELKEILIEKWGKNRVVPISNFNKLKYRSLIKDASKLLGIDYQEVNSVTSVMLAEATPAAKRKNDIKAGAYEPTYEEVKEFSDTLRNFYKKYPEVETMIEGLLGQIRSCSRHAGGVCIGDDLSRMMPLIASKGVVQTPWAEGQNVRHLEPLGFIKFDILGINTLNIISNCIKRIIEKEQNKDNVSFKDIQKWYKENLDPSVNKYDDKEVYENTFHAGRWPGIFQFTKPDAQSFCSKAKPYSIADLSAITSIYRPGPISANVHNDYIKVKESGKVKYINDIVKKVLEPTYGFLIYQEQIALLASQLGKGITLNEGNYLRKLLTKKGTGKGLDKIEVIKVKFFEGCIEKGMTNAQSNELWENMENFATYGFNKSHAVSYSIVSYQCAYLFTKYPDEWIMAYLDKVEEKEKEEAINITKSLGYEIHPVSIIKSKNEWTIDENKRLIQPFSFIKGLGDKAIEQIYIGRPFEKVEDLIFNDNITYSKLNKKALDVLIRSGALDELIDNRFNGQKHFWKAVAEDRPKTLKAFNDNIEKYKDEGDFTLDEKIDFTITLTGTYPFDLVVDSKTLNTLKKCDVNQISDYDYENPFVWFLVMDKSEKTTRNGKKYFVLTVTDLTNKPVDIKCWHETASITKHGVYLAKLNCDDWGFSSKSEKNFRKL